MQARARTKMMQIATFPGLKGYSLHGACNGFLLFGHPTDVEKNPELLVNPLTKETLRLPRAPDLQPTMSVHRFGFDRTANTYKMVQIEHIYYNQETCIHLTGARVYDFEKRLWRTCKAPPPLSERPSRKFVFASGALNWLLVGTRAMLSFDLSNEEFSLIPTLDDFYGCARLHQLGGSLALFRYRDSTHLEVLVLEDSTSREWTGKYWVDLDRNYSIVGLASHNKRNELILQDDRRDIYSCDLSKKRFTRCGHCNHHCIAWCASATLSLVSLKGHFG